MPSGQIFGKYDVLRRLAVGGMGEIHLGRQRGVARFERLVILKTLLPENAEDQDAVAAFLDEAGIVGCINHPNVVGLYDVGEHQGEYVMVMEHIHGVELSQLRKIGLAARRPMPPHVAAEAIRQAALGLDAAHTARDGTGKQLHIVHRDISPQNIMVRPDGNVKVLDFGVARAELRSTKTQAGQLKGKLGYMSPEQIATKPLDGRHDQWSLGVVFWELLAGRRLFQAEDMIALLKTIMNANVAAPSTINAAVPEVLDQIVLRMLKGDREQRYPSLADAARALRGAIDVLPGQPDDLARYVQEVAGSQLEDQMKVLLSDTPQLQAKPGAAARRSCARCGYEQPTANRFCASCGKPFESTQSSSVPRQTGGKGAPAPVLIQDPSGPMPAAPRGPAPAPAASAVPVPRIVSDERTMPLPDALSRAAAPAPAAGRSLQSADAVVVVVRLLRAAPAALRALAEHARAWSGLPLPGDGALAVAFGLEGPADTDRALAFALDVAGVLAPHDVQARVAMARGEARVAGDAISGPALLTARALVETGEPGVVVDEPVRQALRRRWAQSRTFPFTGPAGAGRAIEIVGGPSTRPPPAGVVGRDNELAVIAESLAEAQRRRGGLLWLHGAPGVGKSALLNEVAPLCVWKGFSVARASGSLRVAMPPLDVVRQLCRSLLLSLAGDLQRTVGSPGIEDGLLVAGLGPGDRARLHNLMAPRPFVEPVPLARRAAALRASVGRLFVAAARLGGLCVLVDDVDQVDAASLALLQAMPRRLERERALIVVASSRPPDAAAAAGTRALALAPLDDANVDRLVVAAVGPAAAGVAASIRAAAQGNPRAALCAAGAMAAAGAMVRVNDRWEPGPAPPPTEVGVDAVVDGLVRRLSLQSRAYLCAVAVAGGAVPEDPRVAGAYDEAAALGLVPASQGRPPPLSPTVQRALVRSAEATGAAFLRELHDVSAARARQRLDRDPAAFDVLAFHRRFADLSGLAIDEYVAALAHHGALGVVEPLLDTGVKLCHAVARGSVSVPPGLAGDAVLDVVALVLEALVDADAAAALKLADELAPALAPRGASAGLARIARRRAHALARVGRGADAEAALRATASFAAAANTQTLEAVVLLDLARVLEARGDQAGALRSYQDAVSIEPGPAPGDEGATWAAPLGVAMIMAARGAGAEAQAAFARARLLVTATPVAEAELSLAQARTEAAWEPHAAAAIAAADRSGDVMAQVRARMFRAERLAAVGGNRDAARATLAEAKQVAQDALDDGSVDVVTRALAALAG